MSGFDPDASKQAIKVDPSFAIRKELQSGERILWQGQPIVERVFKMALAIYLFAIPWTAFSLFWEAMALSPWLAMSGNPEANKTAQIVGVVFPLFGLPFIAIGFWMLSRPFALARKARQTSYVITNKRALVVTGGSMHETQSYPYDVMSGELNRTERRDGSGSLYFSSKKVVDSDGDARVEKLGFEYVPHVREVEEKLRRALADSAALKRVEEPSSPSY